MPRAKPAKPAPEPDEMVRQRVIAIYAALRKCKRCGEFGGHRCRMSGVVATQQVYHRGVTR